MIAWNLLTVSVALTNVSSCTNTNSTGYGGGLYTSGAAVLNGSTVISNSRASFGAAVTMDGQTTGINVQMIGAQMFGNQASACGAAVHYLCGSSPSSQRATS